MDRAAFAVLSDKKVLKPPLLKVGVRKKLPACPPCLIDRGLSLELLDVKLPVTV
jgi:hypothetical protein